MSTPRLSSGLLNVAMGCGALFALAAPRIRAQQPQATPTASTRIRPGRVVGVYDAATGEPLADVLVTNTFNGLSAKTTPTGTLSLFFVDSVGGLLHFTKVGYQPLTMLVANSDRDTSALTIVMGTLAQRLAPIVSTAHAQRGPADTVRSLELHGFYDRRLTTGAPSTAFITGDKLEKLKLLSDVQFLSGRQICTTNLYVNGVRLSPMQVLTLGRGLMAMNMAKNPVDQLVPTDEIVGIELYTHSAEMPAEYNMTPAPGTPSCGATLIWTK